MDGKYVQRVLHRGTSQGTRLGVPVNPVRTETTQITFPTTPCPGSGRAALGVGCVLGENNFFLPSERSWNLKRKEHTEVQRGYSSGLEHKAGIQILSAHPLPQGSKGTATPRGAVSEEGKA